MKLLRENGDIDVKFLPRIMVVTVFSLLTSPLRAYEHLRYDSILNRTSVHPSPVFIIGHWRTGTSHLLNLLSQDKNFSFVSTYQAMTSGFCLVGKDTIKYILGWITSFLYKTRLIDNIPLLMDAPQEEEFGIANLCPYSFLHMFSFPRQANKFFDRYVLFKDLPVKDQVAWEQTYLNLIRKTSLLASGNRLILKNPAHSGRLSALLRLFPDAKFIHLYRNPYHVFLSTRRLFQVVLPRSQVQRIDWEQVEDIILSFYSQLMQKLMVDKVLISPQNFVEIKFEDLEEAPLEQLAKIYNHFNIPGYDQAQIAIQSYLDSIAGYRKNEYLLSKDVIRKVNQYWDFAFDEWGYKKL